MKSPAVVATPDAHARKTADGVAVYRDADMSGVAFHSWKSWHAACPDMRQKYATIDGTTYRLRWHS